MSDIRQLKVVIAGDGKRGETTVRKIGTAVTETGDKVERSGSRWAAWGERVQRIGENTAVQWTAAIATIGGATAGLASAIEANAQPARLQAALGIGPDDARELAAVAGRAYSSGFGESLGAVTDSVAVVKRELGGLGGVNIEALTNKALALGDAFGVETQDQVNAVANLLRNGLAKNADEAFDILAKGFQNGANKSGDLTDTLNEYSTLFRNLGLSGTQSLGLISQGLQAGARDSDKVADALKEFSIRAVDGSTTTADAYKALGLDVNATTQAIAKGGPSASEGLATILDKLRAVKDPARQAQIAVGLFGTQAEDMGQALFALDPRTAVDGLGKVAGSADGVGAAMQQAQSPLEAFKRQGMAALSQVMASAVPIFLRVTEALTPHIPLLTNLAIATGVVIAAIKAWNVAVAITAGIQSMASGAMAFTKALSALRAGTIAQTIVQWAQNAAWLAWPGTWIIAAIVLVIAIIAALWVKNEGLRKVVLEVWAAMKKGIGAATDWITREVPEAWRKVVTATVGKWNEARTAVANAVNGVKTAVTGKLAEARNAVTGAWSAATSATTEKWNAIRAKVASEVTGARNAVSNGLAAARNSVTSAWNSAKAKTDAVWTGIRTSVANAITNVRNTVAGLKAKVLGVFANAPSWLLSAGRDIIRGLIQGIRDMIGSLRNQLSSVTNLIPDWKGPLDRDRVLLQPAGRAIIGGLMTGLDDKVPAVKRSLSKLTTDIGASSAAGLSATGLAAVGATGGGPVVNVSVSVAGSVTAERDLARSIATVVRDEIVRKGRWNGGRTGL